MLGKASVAPRAVLDDALDDTFREVDTDGEVDADDFPAGKLEDALDESGEVGE